MTRLLVLIAACGAAAKGIGQLFGTSTALQHEFTRLGGQAAITNAYLAVDSVDADLVDAARGMGLSEWQILTRVELPLAVPLIFVGISTAAVFVVSTTTIASLAGFSGSLGDIIANETSYHFSGVLGAAICVALLALSVEGALALVQRALTPRGVKLERRSRGAMADTVATA